MTLNHQNGHWNFKTSVRRSGISWGTMDTHECNSRSECRMHEQSAVWNITLMEATVRTGCWFCEMSGLNCTTRLYSCFVLSMRQTLWNTKREDKMILKHINVRSSFKTVVCRLSVSWDTAMLRMCDSQSECRVHELAWNFIVMLGYWQCWRQTRMHTHGMLILPKEI